MSETAQTFTAQAAELSNEALAGLVEEEVDYLVRCRPHEVAHIAVYSEIAKRLRR